MNGMQAPVLEGREMQVGMKRCRGEGEGVKRKLRRLHATVEAVYVYEDAGDALRRCQPRNEHSSDDNTRRGVGGEGHSSDDDTSEVSVCPRHHI